MKRRQFLTASVATFSGAVLPHTVFGLEADIGKTLGPSTPQSASPEEIVPKLFITPFGDMPDDVAAYLLTREIPTVRGTLNGRTEATLIDGEISGKRVVIEEGERLYAEFNGRMDLRKLSIFADVLEIRSAFWLPQTSIEIYARYVVFTDSGAIITTPQANITVPSAKPDGSAGDGVSGLAGGDLQLFAESVRGSPNAGPVLDLRGAKGQHPGPGKAPQPGDDRPTLPYTLDPPGRVWVLHGDSNLGMCGTALRADDPHFPERIIYFQIYDFDRGDWIVGKRDWPGDGHDGLPGGKPGEGGQGGAFVTNLDVSPSFFNNSGGEAALAFADSTQEGAPGKPNPSYRVYCAAAHGIENHSEQHFGVPGKPVQSPRAIREKGEAGRIERTQFPLAWVRKENIDAVLRYAEDLYLSRRITEAGQLFSEYAVLTDRALGEDPNRPDAAALRVSLGRLRQRQAQIGLGMDFYGHPAGWVPLLSLEVTEGVYAAELDRAAKAMFLHAWLARRIEKDEFRVESLKLLIESQESRIRDARDQINGLLLEKIPAIQNLLDKIARDQSFVAAQLELREQQLRHQAEMDAEKAEQASRSIASIRLFAACLRFVPVLQPLGSVMATSVEAIANQDNLWDVLRKAAEGYAAGASDAASASDFLKLVDGVDFTSVETLTSSLNSPLGTGPEKRIEAIFHLGEKIYSNTTESLKDKSATMIRADLVERLLAEYEAIDAEYQKDLGNLRALHLEKVAAFAKLQDLQQKLSSLALDVVNTTAAIGNSTETFRDVSMRIDVNTLADVEEIRRVAEQRLRYYHYLMAVAFEYRLLQPYDSGLTIGAEYYKRLEEVADSDNPNVTQQQVDALMAVYSESIGKVTERIIRIYDVLQKPIEQQQSRPVKLSSAELSALGAGRPIFLNLAIRPEFQGLSQENMRLVTLTLQSISLIGIHPDSIDILVRHEGASLVRTGPLTYGFRHLGYDGQPLLTWRSTMDFSTGKISPARPSKSAESLLLTQLKVPRDTTQLFSTPGLDAGLVVTLEPQSATLQIKEITLSVNYTYQQT